MYTLDGYINDIRMAWEKFRKLLWPLENRENLMRFREETANLFKGQVRIGFMWLITIYPIFIFLDLWVYPEKIWLFAAIRAGVVVWYAIALRINRKIESFVKSEIITVITILISCASVLVMIKTTNGPNSNYVLGLILILIFCVTIIPLSFRASIIVTPLVLLGYLLSVSNYSESIDQTIYTSNWLFLTCILFLLNISAWSFEQIRVREFRRNDELKTLNQLKTEFFTNVSQEVKKPLDSIIAPLRSLKNGDFGGISGEQLELLNQMEENGVVLLDKINEMLKFSRLKTGKEQIRLTPMDLAEKTIEVAGLFENVAGKKGLSLDINIGEGSDRTVFMDSERYERILSKLLGNAMDSADRGTVAVRLERQERRIELLICVTGIRPSDNKRFHVFQSPEQMGGMTTDLGLAIAAETVDLLQGRITVEDEKEKELRFLVTLPADLEERNPQAVTRVKKAGAIFDLLKRQSKGVLETIRSDENYRGFKANIHTGARILLAEDDDSLRLYIEKTLQKLGHQVISEVNGEKAWESLTKSVNAEILITDGMMPVMDGYALVRKIRASKKHEKIPVIMITARSGDYTSWLAKRCGADELVPKPINMRDLDGKIRNLLFKKTAAEKSDISSGGEENFDVLRTELAGFLAAQQGISSDRCEDVLRIGSMVARELGVEETQALRDALILHDIGKFGMPYSVLKKQGALTDKEIKEIRKYPEIGKRALKSFSSFDQAAEIVYSLKERWDGKGYPKGLSGEEINKLSRIVAVAESYNAMMNQRPYRKALTSREALEELKKNSGTHFDPEVVEALVKIHPYI